MAATPLAGEETDGFGYLARMQPGSGNTSLVEVIRDFEADGFTGQFAAVEGGQVRCFACRESSAAADMAIDGWRRTEGASDPADMAAVAGLTCPRCGVKGTMALKYGPESTPEESEVLRLLE